MFAKILWTIFFVLLIGFSVAVGANLRNNSSKRISGVKVSLPELSKDNLCKIPKKNSNYSDPYINSKVALLIDSECAYQMYSYNAEMKVPIASTTKIMTALVVLENFHDKLDETVTITRKMINVEGSDIQLRIGEEITVNNLLIGLLVKSGNDTAYALAEHFGGKNEFVKLMNEKANYLGLKDTNYQGPAGLDDEGYSTAYDLAILSTHTMKNDKFKEIVRTPNVTVTSTDGRLIHELENSNRMLRLEEHYYFSFATGIKTGFTNEAGHCLVGSAQKDGKEIISVILFTDENSITASARESKKLLEWGFANWTW